LTAENNGSPESEQRFRTLFEQAPFSVQLMSANGRTLQVNQAWKDLWGTQDGDPLLTWVLTDYNMLEDPQLQAKGLTPYLRRAFAGEAVHLPATFYDPAEVGKPGRARWVEATARPIKDADGRVTEVMLIHHDVTERLLAERQLLASELRLKQLANTIPQLAWIADRHGNVEWYNDRWHEFTGWDPEEMRRRGWQAVHDPEVLPSVTARWRQSIDTRKPFRMTFPMRGQDGKYRPFFSAAAPLLNDAGEVTNWFGTNTDVSPLHEAEQVRKEEERRKDEFLAMLAHELRNPLAPVAAAAQLLKLPGLNMERAALVGDIVERQVRHMKKLVDDLLDVSRVTRGLITLQIEPVDLDDVVAAAIEQVQPVLRAAGHRWNCSSSPRGLRVAGDRIRLVQVLVNLLNNAAKYSPPGSLIELDVRREGNLAVVGVRDNGLGIDADFLPRVFELFSQATRTPDRSQGGLGIGLALVKSLAEMHGGRVSAASDGLGRGSTFAVTLPLAPGTAEAQHAAEDGHPSSAACKPLRIMVVDDNDDAASTLAALLELSGHEVHTAGDAWTALAEAPAFGAQVYVLDIGLPQIDGYELARRLRAQPSSSSATYIALSGYGQSRDRELSREAGFDTHLVKPVGLDDLEEVLRRVAEGTQDRSAPDAAADR